MSKTLTASDRTALIRLASALPAGSPERRAILSSLSKRAREYDPKDVAKQIDRAKTLSGVDPALAKHIVTTGLDDGVVPDDVIPMGKTTVSAGKLKPSQTTMQLPKTLGMAIAMLLGKMPLGGDLGAIISSDGHILDGHHRWSAAIAAGGPGVSVGGYKAKMPGAELIKVLNIVTKGVFGRNRGNPGTGNISSYTPANVRKALAKMVESGTDRLSAADVEKALTLLGGSVEDGIEQMAANIASMPTSVPAWAPDRADMPVIDGKDLPETAKVLNKGLVNWNTPITPQDRRAMARLASALPAGSPERRAILAGLQKGASTRGDVNVPGKHILDRAEVRGNARVYENAKVTDKVVVGENARVYGKARVSDNAWVYGKAEVLGKAGVFGNANVLGNALVGENAKVHGNAMVDGDAVVYGKADVYDNAFVSGKAVVKGNAKVLDNAKVYDAAQVYDNAEVGDKAKVYGKAQVGVWARVYGKAHVFGNATVSGKVDVSGVAKVYGNAKVFDKAQLFGNARIGGKAVILGGRWDGSEGEITEGTWKSPTERVR